jgi:hypothetical protein
MGKITWLASYPKSGRTWMRVFLQNYLYSREEADINTLEKTVASYRHFFDDLLGVETSNLTEGEIETYRARSFRLLAEQAPKDLILKVHDVFGMLADGSPIFPPQVSSGAVYILRNPLDVAVSYSFYAAEPIDKSIQDMANSQLALGAKPTRLYTHVRQKLGSWSQHVTSWADQRLIPVQIVRYEDLLAQPLEAFAGVVSFMGLAVDPERLQKAVEAASFTRLQKQEKDRSFGERPPRAQAFFRQGKAGSWREALSPAQRDQVIASHHDVMQRFGYLDPEGNPIF